MSVLYSILSAGSNVGLRTVLAVMLEVYMC